MGEQAAQGMAIPKGHSLLDLETYSFNAFIRKYHLGKRGANWDVCTGGGHAKFLDTDACVWRQCQPVRRNKCQNGKCKRLITGAAVYGGYQWRPQGEYGSRCKVIVGPVGPGSYSEKKKCFKKANKCRI